MSIFYDVKFFVLKQEGSWFDSSGLSLLFSPCLGVLSSTVLYMHTVVDWWL